MAAWVKITAYTVFVVIALWCAIGFTRSFSKAATRPAANPALSTNTTAPDSSSTTGDAAPSAAGKRKANVFLYGAGMIIGFLGLGLLLAYDFTHFFAEKVEEFVWEDRGEEYHSPEYDDAEKVWANGQHLDAIQLLRDYLKEHPREQYAAIRIAEIYEKDLNNPLAAALEYEEIIKKPLPPEKWGWIAIHLANLYSGKLNRTADAESLLRRIAAEHPSTQAAAKARERLGEPPPTPPAQQQAASSDSADSHHLPPGFRPKGE